MTLHVRDLPPALRKQVEESTGKPARQRTTRRGTSTRTDGRCECGEPFTSTTAWERHSDQLGSGHRRFVLISEERDATAAP